MNRERGHGEGEPFVAKCKERQRDAHVAEVPEHDGWKVGR
jgi:hypothetical protein